MDIGHLLPTHSDYKDMLKRTCGPAASQGSKSRRAHTEILLGSGRVTVLSRRGLLAGLLGEACLTCARAQVPFSAQKDCFPLLSPM